MGDSGGVGGVAIICGTIGGGGGTCWGLGGGNIPEESERSIVNTSLPGSIIWLGSIWFLILDTFVECIDDVINDSC